MTTTVRITPWALVTRGSKCSPKCAPSGKFEPDPRKGRVQVFGFHFGAGDHRGDESADARTKLNASGTGHRATSFVVDAWHCDSSAHVMRRTNRG